MGKISETYLEINKVPTKISTIGKEVGQQFNQSEDLVIIVPGNPGINSFYDRFAMRIHEKLQCSVWSIGHAGHNQRKSKLKTTTTFNENKELYGLKGQVQHKVEFFEKYVPKNARVHLVGHSIGSYMILEMLDKPSIAKIVNKSYLLFPTIEHMAESPNGKFLINFVKNIVWLLVFLSALLSLFPTVVQNFLIYIYMYLASVPKHNLSMIKELVKPDILTIVFFLAYEEMDQVLQRNDHSIKQNFNKIKFCYSNCDGWAPISYCKNIKSDYPDVEVEVTNFKHAFVLSSSCEVGDIVCDWITSKNL